MNPYIQYMAEEVAENHRDGLLSRRQAMKQLAHLGLTTLSASAFLAACGGDDNKTDTASQGTTTAPAGQGQGTPTSAAATATTALSSVPAALPTQDISYAGKGRQVKGVFAAAATPRGAVLVIHENQGVTAFQKSIVGRLAAAGFTSIGVDLLSPQGGTSSVAAADISRTLTENATNGTTIDDMKSTLEELQRRAPNQKLGATGFCFGGSMTWDLVAAGDPPALAAAVPFYGSPQNPIFTKTKAAVLAMYGETDTRINATQPQARLGLQTANLTFDMKTYPGMPHAFMRGIDDTASPNFTQATAGFLDMVAWFTRHLR